jgi:hypothetical protein
MSQTLFVLPYGTERSYNALRLAGALGKREGEVVWYLPHRRCGRLREGPPENTRRPL